MWLAALCVFFGRDALAHHSAAAYDTAHPLILSGTVKDFIWRNPHSQLTLVVPGAAGGAETWLLDNAAPSLLSSNGWSRDVLLPGQRIQVLIAPMRDGSQTGDLLSVRFNDGRILHRCDCERVRAVLRIKSF